MVHDRPPVPATVPFPKSESALERSLVSSSVSATLGLKLAVTALAAFMVTVQVEAVPLQAPPHPVKPEPPEAVAVSVTVLPAGYSCEQSDPQAMPAGLLVTVPDPLPALVTVSS